MKKVAIIGAGAAGCFSAIILKRLMPETVVDIYESGPNAMAKLSITGGGRCNLTNSFANITSLAKIYPRGEKLMKRTLKVFSNEDAMQWFENEGVRLIIQEDGCVFPKSQDAMEIVRILHKDMRAEGISIHYNHRMSSISKNNDSYNICFENGREYKYNKLLIATGSPNKHICNIFARLGLEIINPVPSLFTFSMPKDPICSLMGTVVENTSASISGTNFKADGSLLITDWGMSGPAILKLSSYAARYLAEKGYNAEISINWAGNKNRDNIANELQTIANENPQKKITSSRPYYLPLKLWQHLIGICNIRSDIRWSEIGSKSFNKLTEQILNDTHRINGKSRHRNEFVTCGGISLSNISINTLECKSLPGIYFAGEVLDVDAITGGFNLQAAWSMAYVAAKSLSMEL